MQSTRSDELVEPLERLALRLERRPVLFPCADSNVLAVSRNRERLAASYEVVLPPHDVVDLLSDKARFYPFAEKQGLPIPTTFILRESSDIRDAARGLRFPCILKPATRTPEWDANRVEKAFRVEDGGELARLFAANRGLASTMIAQDWIAGGDAEHYSTNLYIDRAGEVAVAFTTRKLRQWPSGTGQGTLSVEARNEVVVSIARRLFGLVPFTGLGYVEVKRDASTGKHLIIEPNIGRPTGRSANAEAAGVELLYTMYRDALGMALPDQRDQPFVGTKWIHFRRDVHAAFSLWRAGELTLRDWARSWRGLSWDATCSWRDPMPFLFEMSGAVGRNVTPRRRRANTHETPVLEVSPR